MRDIPNKYMKSMKRQKAKKQRQSFIGNDLKKYFQNTPKDQIIKQWENSDPLDIAGPCMEEFLTHQIDSKLNNAKREL